METFDIAWNIPHLQCETPNASLLLRVQVMAFLSSYGWHRQWLEVSKLTLTLFNPERSKTCPLLFNEDGTMMHTKISLVKILNDDTKMNSVPELPQEGGGDGGSGCCV